MSDTSIAPTWSQMFAGELSPDEATSLIQRALVAADEYLASDDEAGERALGMIGRRLEGRPDADTYQIIFDSLVAFAGTDPANLFHWYTYKDDPDARALIESGGSPRVLTFLRRAVAQYGPELRTAVAVWRELPNDWRLFDREVYYDVIRERHHLKHKIEKMNGETILLDGTPDSTLGLVRAFIVSLRWLQSADAFTPRTVELFLPEFEEFANMLRSGGESPDGQANAIES